MIDEAVAGRTSDDGKREQMIEKLAALQKQKAELAGELKNYERSDPKQLEKMKDDMKVAKEAVNRWTDNLSLVLQWI